MQSRQEPESPQFSQYRSASDTPSTKTSRTVPEWRKQARQENPAKGNRQRAPHAARETRRPTDDRSTAHETKTTDGRPQAQTAGGASPAETGMRKPFNVLLRTSEPFNVLLGTFEFNVLLGTFQKPRPSRRSSRSLTQSNSCSESANPTGGMSRLFVAVPDDPSSNLALLLLEVPDGVGLGLTYQYEVPACEVHFENRKLRSGRQRDDGPIGNSRATFQEEMPRPRWSHRHNDEQHGGATTTNDALAAQSQMCRRCSHPRKPRLPSCSIQGLHLNRATQQSGEKCSGA